MGTADLKANLLNLPQPLMNPVFKPRPPQAPNRCSFRDPTSVRLKISVLSFCVLFQHTRNRWETASWPAGFLQRSGRSLLWPPSRGFLLFPDTGLRVSRLLSSLPCLLNRNPAAAWMPEDLFLETEAGMWVERIWGVVGSIIIFFFLRTPRIVIWLSSRRMISGGELALQPRPFPALLLSWAVLLFFYSPGLLPAPGTQSQGICSSAAAPSW